VGRSFFVASMSKESSPRAGMSRLVVDGTTYCERSLDEVIDDLGFGWAQRLFTFVGGGMCFLSGSIKQLVGVVALAVAADFQFSTMQRGWLASIVFVGNLLGNLCASGADTYGRRRLALGGSFTTFVGWVLSCWAVAFWSQLLCRFVLGFGFGFGGPPFFTLLNEICPTEHRLYFSAFAGMTTFTVGMAFGLFLVYLQDPDIGSGLDWRELTAYTAAPGLVILAVAAFFLPESPRFYAAKGRREEAVKCLEDMRRQNGRPDVSVHDWTFIETSSEELGWSFIWHRQLRCTTVTLCLSTFVLNYTYYGGIYALPQVLPAFELGVSPAMNLLLACLVEILGYGLALLIGTHISRQTAMVLYLSTIFVLSGLFAVMMPQLPAAGTELTREHFAPLACIVLSIYGQRLIIAIGWTVVYLYACEVYPTAIRASGASFAIAFGRLGSILAPLSFEIAVDFFWWSTTLLCAVNCVAVTSLPVMTKDRALGEIANEVCPINKSP